MKKCTSQRAQQNHNGDLFLPSHNLLQYLSKQVTTDSHMSQNNPVKTSKMQTKIFHWFLRMFKAICFHKIENICICCCSYPGYLKCSMPMEQQNSSSNIWQTHHTKGRLAWFSFQQKYFIQYIISCVCCDLILQNRKCYSTMFVSMLVFTDTKKQTEILTISSLKRSSTTQSISPPSVNNSAHKQVTIVFTSIPTDKTTSIPINQQTKDLPCSMFHQCTLCHQRKLYTPIPVKACH